MYVCRIIIYLFFHSKFYWLKYQIKKVFRGFVLVRKENQTLPCDQYRYHYDFILLFWIIFSFYESLKLDVGFYFGEIVTNRNQLSDVHIHVPLHNSENKAQSILFYFFKKNFKCFIYNCFLDLCLFCHHFIIEINPLLDEKPISYFHLTL